MKCGTSAVEEQLITTPKGCGYNWHSTVNEKNVRRRSVITTTATAASCATGIALQLAALTDLTAPSSALVIVIV